MLAKRIIPCLDVTGGRVVKGTNFIDLKDAGDPVELAKLYNQQGADELVFLDITATSDARNMLLSLIERTAKAVHIPFTVGGGIRSIADVKEILNAGADKASLNSAAIKTPQLVSEISQHYGAQCLVIAVDSRLVSSVRNQTTELLANIRQQGFEDDLIVDDQSIWEVVIHGGRLPTGIDVIKWVKFVEKLGAGELLLTSMDRDGTKSGYDLDVLRAVGKASTLPLIASGGAGALAHIVDALQCCDAALLASLLHFRELTIPQIKDACREAGLPIR